MAVRYFFYRVIHQFHKNGSYTVLPSATFAIKNHCQLKTRALKERRPPPRRVCSKSGGVTGICRTGKWQTGKWRTGKWRTRTI